MITSALSVRPSKLQLGDLFVDEGDLPDNVDEGDLPNNRAMVIGLHLLAVSRIEVTLRLNRHSWKLILDDKRDTQRILRQL